MACPAHCNHIYKALYFSISVDNFLPASNSLPSPISWDIWQLSLSVHLSWEKMVTSSARRRLYRTLGSSEVHRNRRSELERSSLGCGPACLGSVFLTNTRTALKQRFCAWCLWWEDPWQKTKSQISLHPGVSLDSLLLEITSKCLFLSILSSFYVFSTFYFFIVKHTYCVMFHHFQNRKLLFLAFRIFFQNFTFP